MNFLFLIFFIFFIIYKIEPGKIRPNFNEIFGKEWNKNGNEEKLIKIEQSDQSENSRNDQMDGENGKHPNDQQKREMIEKFQIIKEKLREKGKYQNKNRTKIEKKIAKLLGGSRDKIYNWKKEMNLNKKNIMEKSYYDEKKKEFIERIDEFKTLYKGKQKEFVKELGISEETFRKWKKELLPNYYKTLNIHSTGVQLKKIKQYFEIKEQNSGISDEFIANKLKIGSRTLFRWKKKFSSISEM